RGGEAEHWEPVTPPAKEARCAVPKLALVVGALLIVVGGWAYTASGPGASPTALIPAFLGLALVVAGLLGLRGGGLRRHAMHAGAAVALGGVLGSLWQLVTRPAAGSEHAGIALVAGALTAVLCAVFLALAVRSFLHARRTRG
ncbi:MAG TPA: hypothetical protein VGR21_13535, partial [Cryptosporangiaceae bacterium]|nr:hypothetical protein [Cryptosporangiaceae bacterium]